MMQHATWHVEERFSAEIRAGQTGQTNMHVNYI